MYEDEPPSEESILAVKRIAKNVDGLLSIPEYVKYRNKSEPNIGSIIDDFGGLWRDVQISAGIPNPTIFSKDECIEAIQHVNKLIDDSPTRREYKLVSDQPPQIYIEALFGDWFEAKKEANCHISNEDTYSKKKKFRDEDYYLKDISETKIRVSGELVKGYSYTIDKDLF